MEDVLKVWLPKVGDSALRKLWKYANDKDTPQAEQVRLWKYFIDLTIGTPRQMTMKLDGDAKGGGVVILPAVMSADTPPTWEI